MLRLHHASNRRIDNDSYLDQAFLVYNLAAYASDPLAELRLSTDDGARQQIIALTRDLNLDVPPPLRYFLWLKGVLGIFVGKFESWR